MKRNKLTIIPLILMIITSVFGLSNVGIGFYRMGYASITMFVIAGVVFFIPFILMMIEFGTSFNGKKQGMFEWLRQSVNERFALIGIIMWYSSYIIYLFSRSLSIWQPLSFTFFGDDITISEFLVFDKNLTPVILGILGILLVVAITYLISKGPSKLGRISAIGGISVITLNLILFVGGIIVFMLNDFSLSEQFSLNSLITTPNSDYQSTIPFLSFVVISVFAYGGTEALAGISNDIENPRLILKRGIIISSILIICGYAVSFFMVGAIMSWSDFPKDTNSFAAFFLIMGNLGNKLFGSVGQDIFIRYAGLSMFLSYLGAVIALMYAPLKQVMDGVPKKYFPKSFEVENKNNVKINALKVQMYVLVGFIVIKSLFSLLDSESTNEMYDVILTMINVGMTLPLLFLIVGWYKFRANDSLHKELKMIKSKHMVIIVSIVGFLVVLFGNVFTIAYPFIIKDYSTGIWTIIGPVLFFIVSIVMYKRVNKKSIG